MEVSYRFVSPFIEEKDFNGKKNIFKNKTGEVQKVINNAPYEISIIFSLLNKELNKVGYGCYGISKHN